MSFALFVILWEVYPWQYPNLSSPNLNPNHDRRGALLTHEDQRRFTCLVRSFGLYLGYNPNPTPKLWPLSEVCSFGLHLLDEKHMWAVVSQLLERCETIVILTPHKRPELEGVCGLAKVYLFLLNNMYMTRARTRLLFGSGLPVAFRIRVRN
jgi:hypothetical protein